MSIDLTCPACGAGLFLPDEMAGRKIRCLDCGEVMRVPSAIPAPAPTFESAPVDIPAPHRPQESAVRPRPIPSPVGEPDLRADRKPAAIPIEIEEIDALTAARQRRRTPQVAIIVLVAMLVVAGVGGFYLSGQFDSEEDDSNSPRNEPPARVAKIDPPRPGGVARPVPAAIPQNREHKPIVVPPAENKNSYTSIAKLSRRIGMNRMSALISGGPVRPGSPRPNDAAIMDLLSLARTTDPVAVGSVAKIAADELRLPPATLSIPMTPSFSLAELFDRPAAESGLPSAEWNTRLWRERRHRVYWARLDSALGEIAAGETAGPEQFRVEIPPVTARGTSQVRAVCRLHNNTTGDLSDLIVRATFHDLWGGSVTNYYSFDGAPAGGSVELSPGYDWGPHGLSHTVRIELQLWSQELSAGPWNSEFPQHRHEALDSTLSVARQRLKETGDFGPAVELTARIRPLLKDDLALPQLIESADELEQTARGLERQRMRLAEWIHTDALFEGRWTFGSHRGPLGARIVPRSEPDPADAAPTVLGAANQIEIQIYDPATPPQYKTLTGDIRYSDEAEDFILAAAGRWDAGLDRRGANGSVTRVEIDTMQLLVKSDHRDFDFTVSPEGDLIGTDSLGGKLHLVPRASPDADARIAALRKSDIPPNDPESWRSVTGIRADLLPRERIRPLDGKHSVGEIKRFHAVPEGVTSRREVSRVGFFHRKMSGFAVLGDDQSSFWDFDRDLMIGARPGFGGAVLSSDDRWIARNRGPNVIGIDQTVLGVPDARFTCANFSPDGKQVVAGSAAGEIAAWPVGGDNRLFEVQMSRPITAVALDDHKRLFGAADDHHISIWSLPSKEEPQFLATYLRHRHPVRSIFVAADGKRALSVADDLATGLPPTSIAATSRTSTVEVHVWEIGTQETLQTLKLGESPTAYAISPDWKYALVAEPDHYIYLWDLVAGREVARFLGHLNTVTALAFAPGNRFALSGSADQWVVMWGLPVE